MGDEDEQKEENEDEVRHIERVDVLDFTRYEATMGEEKAVDPSERVTSRFMTKYEKARVLGTRALQIR